jgi:outer membrane protein insertion porin family
LHVLALAALLTTFLSPRPQAQPQGPPPPPPPPPPASVPGQETPPAPKKDDGVIREVRFEGSKRLSDEAVRLQVQTQVGKQYDEEVANADLKFLAARFQVWGKVEKWKLPDGTLRIVFRLDDVPTVVRVQFLGNSHLDETDLRETLGISHGGVPPAYPGDAQKALWVRQLEEKYHDEGYLYCEIDASTVREGDEWLLVFHIIEGPEVSIDEIDFVGLEYFPPRYLRSVMKTSRSFLFFTQTYKPAVLHDDVVKIEEFLSDEGFLDARASVESITPNEDGDEVDILIRIVEGPRYTVRSVSFEGNTKFSSDELLSLVKMHPGQPYRQTVFRKDRARVLDHYGHQGYIQASIPLRPTERLVEGQSAIDVVFEVKEDEPKRVRDVKVTGNKNTRDDVVRRELDLYPGDLFDVKEMHDAEDRLRATGFFADERGNPHAWVEHKPTDDKRVEDIELRVEDGTAGLFSLFGGLSSGSGFFLGADLSIENFDATDLPTSPGATLSEFLDQRAFHGGGQKLHLRANPGNEYSNYLIDFLEPYLFGPQENPWFFEGDLHLNEYTSRHYDQYTAGGTGSIGKRLSRRSYAQAGIRQDRIVIDNVQQRLDPIDDLEAVEGGNSVRGLVGEWGWKDFDSLRFPTQGVRLGMSGEWLGGPFQAQYDVYKLSAVTEFLYPIWENEEEQRHVVSVRGSAAWAKEYADTGDVPFFERYFAGGPFGFLQMRGFEYRGVGPHDGNFSEGGSVGWVVNTEYVFPLMDTYDARIRESQPFLRGVLFADQGMLAEDIGALRHDKWRLSVGCGIRMRIPFQLLNAPLELYYGIPLQRASQDERESFQINFSTRF